MKIRPLGTRVKIKPDEPETVTKGGIHIPAQAQEKLMRGTVISVGEDVTDVESGERVMYDKYSDKVEITDGNILVDFGDLV